MSQTQFSLSRLQLLLPSLFVLLQGIGGNEVFKVSGYLQKIKKWFQARQVILRTLRTKD